MSNRGAREPSLLQKFGGVRQGDLKGLSDADLKTMMDRALAVQCMAAAEMVRRAPGRIIVVKEVGVQEYRDL